MVPGGEEGLTKEGWMPKGLLVSREKLERELEGPTLTAQKALEEAGIAGAGRWLGGRVLLEVLGAAFLF